MGSKYSKKVKAIASLFEVPSAVVDNLRRIKNKRPDLIELIQSEEITIDDARKIIQEAGEVMDKICSATKKEVFDKISSELLWLHARWIFYGQLFNSSRKRRALLDKSARLLFWIIETSLMDEILLGLCKLTDPAKMNGNDNLSFKQLHLALEDDDPNLDFDIKKQLEDALDNLDGKCKEFRTLRNKRLAHLDLQAALGVAKKPLPSKTIKMIENALEQMRDYMNTVEKHDGKEPTGYKDFLVSPWGDPEALVSLLKQGMRYKELLKGGKLSDEDLSESMWKDA